MTNNEFKSHLNFMLEYLTMIKEYYLGFLQEYHDKYAKEEDPNKALTYKDFYMMHLNEEKTIQMLIVAINLKLKELEMNEEKGE